MVIVGSMSYIGLVLLGIPYAMSLALIAGMLEMVPMVGPTVALVPALIVGFATSPIHGIVCFLGLYILIQQLENNLIVPKVMQKRLGLTPSYNGCNNCWRHTNGNFRSFTCSTYNTCSCNNN